jgi:hypothetical protein
VFSAFKTYNRLKKSGIIVLIIFVSTLFLRMNLTKEPLKEYRVENVSVSDSLPPAYHYLGAEKCAAQCHNNEKMGFQYDLWKKSSHSDSYKVLNSKKAKSYLRKAHISGDPIKIQACLKCHITAAGLDSTYITATYRKDDGVTCEACHKRFNNPKTHLPSEPDCLFCHINSLHPMPAFNFREKIRKIGHKRPVNL